MQFFFPWMLLGLLGVSVPIVIHLINKYRFVQVDWGAMELLRRAQIVRARRIRLEDLLLLILRCAIVALVALALARPILTPSGAPWLGKSNDVAAVILLDSSFSMEHRPGSRSRFDRAAERVREIAKTLKPGNPVTLALMGDKPRFILRNEAYGVDRFDAKLKEATPLPERLDLEACLDEVAQEKFLSELKAPVIEFYLVSDMQLNSWSPLSEKVRQSLAQLAKVGRVFLAPVAVDNSENLAVTRLDLKTGLVRKGATVEVEVANYGEQRRNNVTVSLLVDDIPVEQGVIDQLDAGKSETLSLFARLNKAGTARLAARIEPDDELPLDNSRRAVVTVRDKTRVLLVRASGGKAGGDEKDYVLTALAPAPAGPLDVDSVSWLDLPTRKLADYQIVILSNVPDLADEQIRTLYYFVRDGGGLIVFLGENSQPELLNARFQYEGASLLPAKVIEQVGDAKGWSIKPVEHPVSHVVCGLPTQVIDEARIFRYFKMELGKGSREALKLADSGEPLIAEKSLGRGKVVLFGCSPERAWSNLVVEPGLLPILAHETVRFLRVQPHERAFVVSEPLLLPLPIASDEEASSVRKATFQVQGGRATTRDVEIRDGQPYAWLARAEQPGFYDVRVDDNKAISPLTAAVNVDPSESRVQVLSAAALADTLRDQPVRLISDGDSLESSVRESRIGRELWKELLLLLLAVLVVEGFLARWFTRKKMMANPVSGEG